MALGAITPQQVVPSGGVGPAVGVGPLKLTVTNVVGDGAYAAGGSALSAAQLGLNKILYADVSIVAGNANANGIIYGQYNQGTGKLQAFSMTTAGAVTENTVANTSGITWQIQAFGF